KNPTGFNQLIRTLLSESESLNMVFILNDFYADGRDVSWIWDVEFEQLKNYVNWLALSGKRAEELMLRVKYADFDLGRVGIEKNYDRLIDDLINTAKGERIYLMSTYTGMLEFRECLVKRGVTEGFWKD
ncbi:DUF1727 domain-containing protein, partial [Patescibacteria group bacterium]|nr:DUF1727 domain-containing protein [Patescibacteria group bacterium]